MKTTKRKVLRKLSGYVRVLSCRLDILADRLLVGSLEPPMPSSDPMVNALHKKSERMKKTMMRRPQINPWTRVK